MTRIRATVTVAFFALGVSLFQGRFVPASVNADDQPAGSTKKAQPTKSDKTKEPLKEWVQPSKKPPLKDPTGFDPRQPDQKTPASNVPSEIGVPAFDPMGQQPGAGLPALSFPDGAGSTVGSDVQPGLTGSSGLPGASGAGFNVGASPSPGFGRGPATEALGPDLNTLDGRKTYVRRIYADALGQMPAASEVEFYSKDQASIAQFRTFIAETVANLARKRASARPSSSAPFFGPTSPYQSPVTRITLFKLKHLSAEECQALLSPILNNDNRSAVSADARTNTLIVRTTEDRLKDIETIVGELDIPDRVPAGNQLGVITSAPRASPAADRMAGTAATKPNRTANALGGDGPMASGGSMVAAVGRPGPATPQRSNDIGSTIGAPASSSLGSGTLGLGSMMMGGGGGISGARSTFPSRGGANRMLGDLFRTPAVTEAERRYTGAEEVVGQLTAELAGKTGKDREKALAQLQDALYLAFDARQTWQDEQARELSRRTEEITRALIARKAIREKIVQHRFGELANPEIRWDASSTERTLLSQPRN